MKRLWLERILVIAILSGCVLLSPALIPCALIHGMFADRRRRRTADEFHCTQCGEILGRASIAKAGQWWSEHVRELRRKYPGGRLRLVRHVWAIFSECGASYYYHYRDNTYRTTLSLDLAGLLGLAACAGAAARRVEIKLSTGWHEPINLFAVTLLEPGNRKSTVFSSALNPLRMVERELMDNAKPDHAREASELRTRETQLKELERKAAKGDLEASKATGDLAASLALRRTPTLPKLIVAPDTLAIT